MSLSFSPPSPYQIFSRPPTCPGIRHRTERLTADARDLVVAVATVLLVVALPVNWDASSVATPELRVRTRPAHCNTNKATLYSQWRAFSGGHAGNTHTDTERSSTLLTLITRAI